MESNRGLPTSPIGARSTSLKGLKLAILGPLHIPIGARPKSLKGLRMAILGPLHIPIGDMRVEIEVLFQ
jgi:hypothetical protein